MPNLQRMVLTGAREGRPICCVESSRGASIPSGVEPARRRFVKSFSMRIAFWPTSSHQALTQKRHGCGILSEVGCPPGNRPIMTVQDHAVQSNHADDRHTSVSILTPGSLNRRKARRAAAGFNLNRNRNHNPFWGTIKI